MGIYPFMWENHWEYNGNIPIMENHWEYNENITIMEDIQRDLSGNSMPFGLFKGGKSANFATQHEVPG